MTRFPTGHAFWGALVDWPGWEFTLPWPLLGYWQYKVDGSSSGPLLELSCPMRMPQHLYQMQGWSWSSPLSVTRWKTQSSCASHTLIPAGKNYYLQAPFFALKYAITEQFCGIFYYAPEFTMCTDNNPLAYILTSSKQVCTGLEN